MPSKIVVIVGPNASGKSDFGVQLAKKIGGEIISADSRQVYKGLNIGSGKITKKEMRGVPHHCLGIANPKKIFTALDFKKCAERAITDILSRGKTPIIVGGTGFYIDAALNRVKLGGVPPNRALRKKLINYSTTKLLNYLTKLDPKRAKTIEQKNPRRLIRAIEIACAKHDSFRKHAYSSAGELLCSRRRTAQGFLKEHALLNSSTGRGKKSKINKMAIVWLGIKRPQEELKKRIHARLIKRLPRMIREVKKLNQQGLSWKRLFDLGLEYRYISFYLQKKLTKDEMTQKILTESWHYAKRQMTWFKRNKKIRWISTNKEALRRAPIFNKSGI